MSDITPTTLMVPSTSDPHDRPLTLTGTPAVIYTELACLADTESATIAELAASAGIGYSTAGKALTALEKHGLAVRTPGGHDGPRRTPDHWRAAPIPTTSTTDNTPAQKAAVTDQENEPASDAASSTEATATDSKSTTAVVPAPDGSQDAASSDTTHANADGSIYDKPRADGETHHHTGDRFAQQTSPRPPAASAHVHTLPSVKTRLAPGALRQMVLDHLQAHPGEAFTATKISRTIDRSSGAIANALDTLTKRGHAERVAEQPSTYRATASSGEA